MVGQQDDVKLMHPKAAYLALNGYRCMEMIRELGRAGRFRVHGRSLYHQLNIYSGSWMMDAPGPAREYKECAWTDCPQIEDCTWELIYEFCAM